MIAESTQLRKIPTTQLQDEVGEFAKPFELLLNQIQKDYGQFALIDSEQDNVKEELQKQFLLLRWYVDKKLTVQAILLGREWIVSALCLAEGVNNYRDRPQREVIEKQLGQMIGATPNLNQPIVKHISSTEKLAALWSKLTEYRNDLAHAQMRPTTISASTLQEYVDKKLIQSFSELFTTLIPEI